LLFLSGDGGGPSNIKQWGLYYDVYKIYVQMFGFVIRNISYFTERTSNCVVKVLNVVEMRL
jgi:hypothetical protein